MNICEDCTNYNPMSCEEGFCDRTGIIVEFSEINSCHSSNNYDFDDDFNEDGE